MRLLNARSKELELLHGPLRRYAIVSHRWGAESEEVLFTDIGELSRAQSKGKGYDKITCACAQALKDDLAYVWLDTCCINRDNNTELTEALNSMYNWYQKAQFCYVYLHDVTDLSQVAESEWFRRGWTLQELIAPRSLMFFNKDWMLLGTREDLMEIIMERTGITTDILTGEEIPQNVSIAQRMFWASQRVTTKVEDRAYSLLGILGISMAATYGIGNVAFEELQHKIITRSHDQTLFAWYHIPTPPSEPPEGVEMADTEPPPAQSSAPSTDSNATIDTNGSAIPSTNAASNANVSADPSAPLPAGETVTPVGTPTSPNATGFLATSPSQFVKAYEISEHDFRKNFVDRIQDRGYRSQFSISNNFVHMSVPIKHHEGKIWKAVLRCSLDPPSDDQIQRPLIVYLEELGHQKYVRTHLLIPEEEQSALNVDEDPQCVPGSIEVLTDLSGYILREVDVIGRLPSDSETPTGVPFHLTDTEEPDSPPQLSEAERIAKLPCHPPGIKTTNIFVCGEPGVGAGRVINLILGAPILKPLTDYEREPMTTTPIHATLSSRHIRILYVTGPRDPYLSVERYHAALKNMYHLVQEVEKAGGVHYMLLVIIGSKITSAAQNNFRLFHDIVCEKQVPTALIVTGLGKTVRMDDWWAEHRYDRLSPEVQVLKFDQSHACITVLQGDTHDHETKFNASIEAIHALLIGFIDRLDKANPMVFRPAEGPKWLISMGKKTMSLLLSAYHRRMLKEEGMTKAFKEGCVLTEKVARYLAGSIYLSEHEMKERLEKEAEIEKRQEIERAERETREKEAREANEAVGAAKGGQTGREAVDTGQSTEGGDGEATVTDS